MELLEKVLDRHASMATDVRVSESVLLEEIGRRLGIYGTRTVISKWDDFVRRMLRTKGIERVRNHATNEYAFIIPRTVN